MLLKITPFLGTHSQGRRGIWPNDDYTATTFKRPNAMGDLPESNGTMFFAVAGLAKQYIFSGDTAVHGIQRFVTIRAAEAQLVILAASRSLNHFGKIDVLSASWTCRACAYYATTLCSNGNSCWSGVGISRVACCCCRIKCLAITLHTHTVLGRFRELLLNGMFAVGKRNGGNQ